jgi:hypothetical protein
VTYACFGYYDKGKSDAMTASERNSLFDTCFEYDDHLRANGHWAGGEALHGPETILTLSWTDGELTTTAGPFAEATTKMKESLAWILLLEARDMNHAVQLISQHPALRCGSVFEIRAAADINEVIAAGKQRGNQNAPSKGA